VNLFIQGMRRSGTTILYDALLADPELRCFYEPLREDKVTEGGGSGAREGDAFAATRALREEFRAGRYPELPAEEFNWGGPRAPLLELEPNLPRHCRDWLGSLIESGGQVAIKETRLWSKAGAAADLDPGAAFVHVVRDPRAVAASIVLGRRRRQAKRLSTPDLFFADRKQRKLWSCWELSEPLLRDVADPSNVLRVLTVWRETFERAWNEGRERFGDRYLLVRNEDLRADPAAALRSVYGVLGRDVPSEVEAWAAANVAAPEPPYAADDPRWTEEMERGGMLEAVANAGFSAAPAGTLDR
jgi:Sulfotransferase family